jgi:adenylosuccinate synthase
MKKIISLFLGALLMVGQSSLYALSHGLVVISLGYSQDGKDKFIYGIIQPDDVVVRAQGAGINKHHVIVDGIDYDLTYIPTAFLIPKVKVYLAGGMVVELPKLSADIKDLKAKGVQDIEERLRISTNAHLILPYHKVIDACAHKVDHVLKGIELRSGVRPASSDKRFGIGIRLADLFSNDFP